MDSRIDKCNICGIEYGHDQTHRRGPDCAGPLAERIASLERGISRLANDLALAHEDTKALAARHEKLAMRVTKLESNAKKQ